jgi:hypothetical protein
MERMALPARLTRLGGLVFAASLALAAFAAAGCGGTSSDVAPGAVDSGVIDSGIVDQASACAARHAWQHAGDGNCNLCLQLAPEVACTCTSDPADGKCAAEGQAVTDEADCTSDVKNCLVKCTDSDCACEDACFVGHDACRAAEGPLGGCLVNVCTERCQ